MSCFTNHILQCIEKLQALHQLLENIKLVENIENK